MDPSAQSRCRCHAALRERYSLRRVIQRMVVEFYVKDEWCCLMAKDGNEDLMKTLGANGQSDGAVFVCPDGRLSAAAADIARGTMRLLAMLSFVPVLEFSLASGRRADIAALGPKGEIWIVEIKSCLNDYRSDAKWPEYADFCDRFLFAVDAEFPVDVIPGGTGLILADRYGAEIVRDGPEERMPAARRKAMTLQLARIAGQRLHSVIDPGAVIRQPV